MDETLLAECDVESFRGSGPGGQHRNKTETAVRLRHRPTGLVAQATERRSRQQNLALALERLQARLDALRAPPPPERRPTRPSRGARERRMAGKARRGETKRLRSKVVGGD